MSNKHYVRNASNENEVRSAEQRDKLSLEQAENDLKNILSTVIGRRFLWSILEKSGIHRSSFTGSSQTFFLEGQRNIGLMLLGDIMRVDPEAYAMMIKESKGIK